MDSDTPTHHDQHGRYPEARTVDDFRRHLADVHTRIADACRRAGRDPATVRLLPVSKTKPESSLRLAYAAGCRQFGEIKAQEGFLKWESMQDLPDLEWSVIGHLQTNKVKYIVDKVALIHSVDSLKLAREISKEAAKKNVVCQILIEVNIGEEESKFGLHKDEVIDLVKEVSLLPNLKIKGLMTVAPYVENAEENRRVFRNLKQLSVDIINKNIDNVDMNIMSMGMSGDFEVAIEEGANCVRIGTSIFGERNYV